ELQNPPQAFVVDGWHGHVGMTPTHFVARVRSGREEGEAQALDRRALYVARGNRNVVTGGSRRPCKCDGRVETAEARDAGEQHAHDSPIIGFRHSRGALERRTGNRRGARWSSWRRRTNGLRRSIAAPHGPRKRKADSPCGSVHTPVRIRASRVRALLWE